MSNEHAADRIIQTLVKYLTTLSTKESIGKPFFFTYLKKLLPSVFTTNLPLNANYRPQTRESWILATIMNLDSTAGLQRQQSSISAKFVNHLPSRSALHQAQSTPFLPSRQPTWSILTFPTSASRLLIGIGEPTQWQVKVLKIFLRNCTLNIKNEKRKKRDRSSHGARRRLKGVLLSR